MNRTVQRILKIMKLRGVNALTLEKDANLSTASISIWKTNKCKPSIDSIIKISRYLNVSADYLLCLSNEPTPLKTANIAERPTYALSTELAELSEDKRFLNSAIVYKELPDEKRENVYAYILGIAVGMGIDIQQILGDNY